MEAAKIVLNQVEVMFFLVVIGLILVKKRIISHSTITDISNTLLYLVVPVLLIKTYTREVKYNELICLMYAFLISIFFHVLGILIANIFIKRSNDEYKIDRLSIIYSNCGFMAFPILSVVLGEKGIFYGSAFVAVFNIFLWTHGMKVLTDNKKLNIKRAVFNPGCIAVMLGIMTYVLQLKYPPVIVDAIDFIAGLNTPLAMFVVGGMLSDIKWKKFLDIQLIIVTFMRMLCLPIAGVLIIKILKIYIISLDMASVCMAITLCAACPVAASITLLPASLGIEASRGAKSIAFTTICSIITLPFVTFIIQVVFSG
ncbi:MAG: AEC family transporter [Clostridium butyricum]|jgi:predicted permease|nr:AEC family transporter [Clostridium butyricum]